jgi:hypothetical protein
MPEPGVADITISKKSPGVGPGNFKYPINRDNQYKSKISFQAIKVVPPEISITFSSSETATEGGASRPPAPKNVSAAGLQIYELSGQKCDLHLPISYQVNDGFDYSTASLGLGGAAVMAGANNGESLASSVFESLKEGAQSVFDLFGSGAVSRVAAVRGSQALPIGDQLKNAVSITARATMNPNLRTQFNGPSIREFNFVFKFIPKSPEESVMVKNIVKFFRFHAYPDEIAPNIAYDYPNMFKIRLLSEVGGTFKNVGTPIKLCYLKTVSTTYNSTSPVLHRDGSPTEIDMNLTFTEYKPLNRDDVRNEDNDIFYNYEGFAP